MASWRREQARSRVARPGRHHVRGTLVANFVLRAACTAPVALPLPAALPRSRTAALPLGSLLCCAERCVRRCQILCTVGIADGRIELEPPGSPLSGEEEGIVRRMLPQVGECG